MRPRILAKNDRPFPPSSLYYIVPGVVLFFVLASAAVALLPPFPNPLSFKGGKITLHSENGGVSESWINDSSQAIYDCLLLAYDASEEVIPPSGFSATIEVNGEVQPWETIDGYQNSNWKKKVTDDVKEACPVGQQILLETSNNVYTLEIWFTNDAGCPIYEPTPLEDTQSTAVVVLPAGDAVFGTRWSSCLRNQADYLITGLTFSETPDPLAMSLLQGSRLGGASAAARKVSFEYPLQPHGGWVVISACYASVPGQDTTVACTPLLSKVIPASAEPHRALSGGTNVSVPDITLKEVSAGSIKIQGEGDAIVLRPRERFVFNSVGGASVISGNLQIGVPSVTNGEIHIPILASSSGEGKSTVEITGITIDTLEGLRKGVISVRQEEPSGNSSNFPYAYFDPDA